MQKKILSLIVLFICSTFALLAQITDGTYYLRNRETGKFLTGGNNWGTNLCLHETGIDFIVNKTDNGYTFNSGIFKPGTNRYYLNSEGSVDGHTEIKNDIYFNINHIIDNVYTIQDEKGLLYATGEQGQGEVGFQIIDEIYESHQWEFLTKADLIEELQGATTAKPMNATFFISGFNFNRYDDNRNNKWIGTKTITGGDEIGTAKFWCARLDGNGDVYQELTGLPTGYYELTAYACSNGGNAKIYAGNTEKAITNVGTNIPDNNTAAAQAFADGNYKTETIVVQVTNGTLKIGVKNTDGADTDKTYFDNFNLKYHGNSDKYDYYLRNVATGKFLRAGKRYGTQAIQDDWGLDLTFKMNDDGYCAINTRVGTDGNNYLGSNGFVDGGETFYEMTEVSANKYTIKIVNGKYLTTNTENDVINFSGTDATVANAQWELVTCEQLIQELKDSEASDTNPKDATFFIQSPNLGQKDQRNNNDNWKGIDFGSSEYGGLTGQGDDKLTNLVIEKYNKNFDTYQTITGLPAGVYELEVQAFYNQSGEDIIRPFIYAKLQDGTVIGQAPIMSNIDNVQSEDYTNYDNLGDKTEFKSSAVDGGYVPTTLKAAALAILNGYYKADAKTGFNKIRFVVTEDNATVQIGVKKNKLTTNDWTVFDNFKLTYLGKNGETQTKYGLEIGEYTYYLKNYNNGRYLNGGNGGNTATLGYLMNENSTYTGDIYNKGVRETEFKFSVIEDDKILIQTDFGNNGYLVKDEYNKAKLDGEKDYLRIRWNETNKTFYIICEANSNEYFLRNSDASGFGFGTSNGTTPGSNFQWVFQTKEDLLNEFSNARADNPVDATFLLKGTSFHNYDNRNSAWDAPNSTLGGTNHNATNSNKTFNISQLLQDAPAGVYEFGLQGAYSNSSNAKYYVYTDGKLYTGEISNSSNLQSHNVIRFKKSDNDIIIVGAYNNTATENATINIDNVRLTYLGTEVNTGFTTETTIAKGIKHKHSHYYDIAVSNSHATVGTQTNNQIITVTDNQTTMSDSAMVEHEFVRERMVQNTPVYYDTIYAITGNEIELVIPSSHPDKISSRNFYYQRFYDYETDDLFDEETKGTFRFDNLADDNDRDNNLHSDATIRDRMRIYEGTTDAPAGGWVIGTRWGQQVIAKFYFKPKFTDNKPIYIGLDHSEYTDVGDMGLFGDLTEPTLAQRVVYVIMPASVMAEKLSKCTGENFLEVKSISFPTIWHGLKNTDYNAVALDKQLRNYFTSSDANPTPSDYKIELVANGTGITLENGTSNAAFGYSTSRFIKFKYPQQSDGKYEVTNRNTAYIYVKKVKNEEEQEYYNIAKFILDFVPNTELRPWGDIIGKEDMPRSPSYLDKNAIPQGTINFDKRYYDNNNELIPHAETWPVGFESGINGVEEDRPVAMPDAFNPYPLDFAQTSFSIHYPNANFGQHSVMRHMYIADYAKHSTLRDVNQLYHDFYKDQQMEKYPGNGYFMYIDASHFPSSVAELTIDEQLCANTTIHFSGWVSALDLSTHAQNNPGYLLFTIVGRKTVNGKEVEEAIESFCPGPIRADAMSYNGIVKPNEYNNKTIDWGTDSRSIWQQFAFSFVIKEEVANEYTSYALQIDNYCTATRGGDMLLDDVRLYIQKAVPNIMQTTPICDAANMDNVKIYTDFTTLINAVGLTEAKTEDDAKKTYNGYLPSAWYCFLDKKIYDTTLATSGKTPADAFNAAMIRTGGNNGAGYYKYDFSSYFKSNDGADVLIYSADSAIITNADGSVAERRIYLTPATGQLTAGETSLKNMAYYLKKGNYWYSEIPVWNVGTGNSVQVVYGHNDAGDATRYTDLGGYEELRIYQTEGNPVRCFFLNKDNTQSKNIADGYTNLITKPEGCDYWKVDLNAIKAHDDFGQAKLIGIKSASTEPGDDAKVSNITLYKSSALELNKPYYILFHATKEEPVIDNPATFFNISNEKCAPLAEFNVSAGTMVRFDGTMSTEDNDFCEGQIATIKAEMQGINNNSVEVKEDLFYDWWNGDRASYTANLPEKDYSAKDVRDMFRKEYPVATIYNDEPATGDFTEAHAASLKELLAPKGKLYLYQSALNVKVVNSGDNMMNVVVIPVDNQIESYEGYCNDPMEISLRVNNMAPTVLDGFKQAAYPDYMQEVPLRIGLEQIKEVTADASSDKALFIPLRKVEQSGTGDYSTISIQKKSDAENYAAVYLAETNDPEMVSYNNVDGNMEMRYVGKMHNIVKSATGNNYDDYAQLTFNSDFEPKEGYRYTLKTSFIEQDASNNTNTCNGDLLIPMYIVPEYQVWTGGAGNNDWTNDRNWRRADNDELDNSETKYTDAGRLTNELNTTSNGLVPMNFTNVLMPSADGTGNSYSNLSAIGAKADGILDMAGSTTHTTDIEYHIVADRQKPTTTWAADNQVYCVPFYTNTCDEINFAPSSQMLNTHLLKYNKAWVEYALESQRWYALSSPLQGVVSGDMYLPRNTAKQNTAYFYDINYDNTAYSRLKPAVYQQAWDKAEATIYRLERDQLINKTPPELESNTATANVARVFNWSKEYNDVKVPFGINGFSVRVDVSDIEGYVKTAGERDVVLRLPKADNTYNYYMGDDETNGSTTADLTTLRNNAGKLFTDNIDKDGNMTVTLTNNSNNNEYYLVGNPFMSALDLDSFFYYNPSLDRTYWILTSSSYTTGVENETQNWLSTDGTTTGEIAPLQAFFVRKTDDKGGELTVKFTKYMAVAATGDALVTRSTASHTPTLRITAMRNGMTSSALVACRDNANSGFKHGEDAEALFDSHLADAPTVFTMSGDKAAAINVRKSLNGVPLGIESNDDGDVSLTFDGVENFSHEVYLYDLLEDRTTPIPESGTTVSVCGKTSGRYYLVASDMSGGAIESAPIITINGNRVSIVSVSDAIKSVTVNDVAGRSVYKVVDAGNNTSFDLPEGIYIINVRTEQNQVTEKILVK